MTDQRLTWTLPCARALTGTGLLSGLTSGLLGVGGGFVIIPALTRYTDLNPRSIQRTSLAVIALVSLSGVTAAALKGSLFGLSDQMRQIVDAVPARLSALTQETLQDLQSGLERSFDGVAERSEVLSEEFRKTATETTEAVLQGYVDFIFLSVERFRRELEEVNETFTRDLESSLAPLSHATSQSLTLAQDEPEGTGATSGH